MINLGGNLSIKDNLNESVYEKMLSIQKGPELHPVFKHVYDESNTQAGQVAVLYNIFVFIDSSDREY
jgi:hypothetical protein